MNRTLIDRIASSSLLLALALTACKSAQGEPPARREPAPAPSAVTAPTTAEVVYFLEAWLHNVASDGDVWGWDRVDPDAKLDLESPAGRCAERTCGRAQLPSVAVALRGALADARMTIDGARVQAEVTSEGDPDVGLPSGSMTVVLHRRTMNLQDGAPIDLVIDGIVARWTAPVVAPRMRLPDDFPETAVATLGTAAQAAVLTEARRLFPACTNPRVAATTGTPVLAVALCPGQAATGGDDVVFLAVRGDDATALAATRHEVDPEYPSALVADDPTPYVFADEICIVVMHDIETRGVEMMLCTPRP